MKIGLSIQSVSFFLLSLLLFFCVVIIIIKFVFTYIELVQDLSMQYIIIVYGTIFFNEPIKEREREKYFFKSRFLYIRCEIK